MRNLWWVYHCRDRHWIRSHLDRVQYLMRSSHNCDFDISGYKRQARLLYMLALIFRLNYLTRRQVMVGLDVHFEQSTSA
jgi:hypothetical protein